MSYTCQNDFTGLYQSTYFCRHTIVTCDDSSWKATLGCNINFVLTVVLMWR